MVTSASVESFRKPSVFRKRGESYNLDSQFSSFMEVLDFIVTVILVTASGALAPGPLFFATLSQGARSGARSGFVFSIAHSMVEFSLVMLLALGLLSFASEESVKLVIGVVGGVVLIGFGLMQVLRPLSRGFGKPQEREVPSRNLIVMGLAFTGLNPFFIVWWLTVGAQLILISLEFLSLAGVVLMYICHVWMDYAWLTGVAHLARKGTSVAGFKLYRIALAAFGIVLIYFGLTFLISPFT